MDLYNATEREFQVVQVYGLGQLHGGEITDKSKNGKIKYTIIVVMYPNQKL